MDRKRKCSEPQRPLTLGTARSASAVGDDAGGAAPPASDIETAQGSLAFIARVLHASQHAARQQTSELAAEQEKHAGTRSRLHRVDAERTDAIQQLSNATQSLRDATSELQSERARHEKTAAALADERAAHAHTEKARQRALDRMNVLQQQEQQRHPPAGRRESAAGIGSALAQRPQRGLHDPDAGSAASAKAVSPRQRQPESERSLADATRALDSPFQRNVTFLQNHLRDGASAATARQPAPPANGGQAHDVSFGADDYWTADYARVSDSDEPTSEESPVLPRPVRNRNAPHRWQDDPMSAVDLGGSSSRLIALKNGEVDVAGSFVRSRQDPKAWPKGQHSSWSRVHQPAKPEGRAGGRSTPRRAAKASVIASDFFERKGTASAASDRSTDNAEDPDKENSSPEPGQERAARVGEHVPTAESPEYAE